MKAIGIVLVILGIVGLVYGGIRRRRYAEGHGIGRVMISSGT